MSRMRGGKIEILVSSILIFLLPSGGQKGRPYTVLIHGTAERRYLLVVVKFAVAKTDWEKEVTKLAVAANFASKV